jgi:hypothetical protein
MGRFITAGHQIWTAADNSAASHTRHARAAGPEVTRSNNDTLIDLRGTPKIAGGNTLLATMFLAGKRALRSVLCQ